jgi:WD40 repeat protein
MTRDAALTELLDRVRWVEPRRSHPATRWVLAAVAVCLAVAVGLVVRSSWSPDESRAVLTGHSEPVERVVFSPDGQTLVTVGQDAVRLWDVATRRQRALPEHYSPFVNDVAYRPDGRVLAVAGDHGLVSLWDMPAGRRSGLPIDAHRGPVTAVAFSPDGKLLATGGVDHALRLWDATGRTLVAEDDLGGQVTLLAFTPDGAGLTAVAGDRVVAWDVAGRHRVDGRLDDPYSVAASADGKTVAAGGYRTLELWDVPGHRQRAYLTGLDDYLRTAAFHPGGRVLAVGGDETLRLWDLDTRHPIGAALTGHHGPLSASGFSPDGQLLATGGMDRTVRLWSTRSKFNF